MRDSKLLKRAFERTIILTILSLLLALFLVSAFNDIYAFVKPSEKVTISLNEPVSLYRFSQLLHEEEIINDPIVFSLFMIFKGKTELIEAFKGELSLNKDMSYREIILAIK